jgi:ParB-like chromosome segregation protein Spo0J
MMRTKPIPLAEIYVPTKLAHGLDPARAEALAEDILENGLQVPIQLRRDEARNRYVLVEGLHRLEAMRLLGETTIESLIVQARKH